MTKKIWLSILIVCLVIFAIYNFSLHFTSDIAFSEEEIAWMQEHPLIRVAPTPQREEYLLLTENYIVIENVVLIRDNFSQDFSETDLSHMKTAVLKDYYIQDILELRYPQISLEKYVQVSDALNALSIREIDALIIDIGQASHYMEDSELGNIVVYDGFELDYHLEIAKAVRDAYPTLRGILDKCLNSMTNREHEAIKNAWIHLERIHPILKKILVIAPIIILTCLIIVTLVIIWNRSLNKQVQLKTKIIQEDYEVMSLLKKQLDDVINSIPFPVYVINQAGEFIHVNDSFSQLIANENLPKINLAQIIQNDRDNKDIWTDLKAYDQEINASSDSLYIPELTLKHKHSKEHIYDVIKLPFNISADSVHGILTVMMDVTDRIIAERKLSKLNDSLELEVENRTKQIQEKNIALNNSIHQLHETQDKLLESEKLASLSR